MNILAIGNSFSQDATRYLTQIAAKRGVYFRTVNLYIGGCPLVRHYNNLIHDNRAYSLEYGGETTGFYASIRQALRARKWDVITLQQVSHKSPRYETYQPYLDVLAAECRAACPEAKIYIHQTWAYEDGSVKLCEQMKYAKSADMFADIERAYDTAARAICADGVIPSGRTMQNIIESGIVAHRDTFHANLCYGRYALGLTWFGTVTGESVKDDTFDSLDEPADKKTLGIVRECAESAIKEYKDKVYK